jgi:flavin reductase (DIM6/NTAB) family NADH-FMN oxidoreductase RutF
MELDPTTISQQSMYKLMIGAIVPRPIGWISTASEDGVYNLAPFSFFNAVCSNPPTMLFCVTARKGESPMKDTLRNVLATGEFVINIVSQEIAEQMNLTSAELPADVSEFEFAGLTPVPALTVRAPRVAESRIHFECALDRTVGVNADEQGGATVVFGRVKHVHIADEVLIGTDKIDPHILRPVGRMAGASYARITDIFEMPRPVVEKKDV